MLTALTRVALSCIPVLILFSSCSTSPTVPTSTASDKSPLKSSSAPKPQVDPKTEHQAKVKEFEAAIDKIDKPILASQEKFRKAVHNKLTSANDVVELINLARQTKQDFDNAFDEFGEVQIDDSLPSDTKDAMEKSKASFRLSCQYRSTAMDAVLKFFDEQKPSQLADFKNQLLDADDIRVNVAIDYLTKARLSVGIKH